MAEATKTSRATAKRLFTRAEGALKQALEAKALEETVRRRFEDYRKRWNTVQELHDEYIEGLGDIDFVQRNLPLLVILRRCFIALIFLSEIK